MTWRSFQKIVVLLVVVMLGTYGIYKYNYPSYLWHQKITIEVHTPNGLKYGSAVTSVNWRKNTFSGSWGGPNYVKKLRGEAIVVDLGDGNYLFGVLGASNFVNLAPRLVILNEGKQSTLKAVKKIKHLPNYILPPNLYPTLVTFKDINDPESVLEIKKSQLELQFGADYKIGSIKFQITNEPVTLGRVTEILNWLERIWPRTLDGQKLHNLNAKNRFANSLSANSFSTEIGNHD